MPDLTEQQLQQLADQIKAWAAELGFQQCGITQPDTRAETDHLQQWLDAGYQGEMDYLNNHLDKRLDPTLLVPGTERIICVRMDYLPPDSAPLDNLRDGDQAYVARYTLGRDYHKLMRKRLTQLGKQIEQQVENLGYRAFVDSAPILERPLARQAGIGWIGKHSLVLNRDAGSLFFLGELFVDLPLPVDPPYDEEHCGRCTACMDVCPTNAFPQPYVLDGRRCISYLTIELKGSIPEELRPLMGNRIFGCDDCQLICPWNRFAHITAEPDFHPRQRLDRRRLVELFDWDEATFLKNTEGSAIRRTGHIGWLRNIAVALGNSRGGAEVEQALRARLEHPSAIVREHVQWALAQLDRAAEPVKLLTHRRGAKLKF
ncbi:tRNA epoxyqueuosine(34) reductase QueG [Marinobacterium arenosum]|uniref:tRNA epoxyqueuosine(34) reductase QueG n=1 Tax=Marinobacterium arenosum TaxID=2862496 RepID=UPI001C96DB50|nr:tRNA epoxyqueuosine(34) reductase QueG [Marinobacterium arenosum]MBY4677051.1 tRNA epoxyqueuosine(34) reductase QueG [Marinobacterium arenosum]